jgi:starch-binding outer membrane protein, SusD/RagB family
MKKIFYYIVVPLMLVAALASCHKLEVEVTTELTNETFPKTEAHYNALMGTVYTLFRDGYTTGHFFVTSQSTDESALLTYGADWIDGNRYMDLHRHTWTKDHPNIGGEWSYFANLIGNTNQILFLLKSADDGPVKTTSIAEMRTMRALFYFYMLDMFGNVPLDTVYGNTELRANIPRKDVFTFVESELKAAIPYLKTASGTATYGKPTRYMAYSLLAKMYLNAEVYTGTAKNNECIAACDSVINAGGGTQYALEPRATYFNMFAPTNGPSFKEFILKIQYDPYRQSHHGKDYQSWL